jgi:hypothetical protein
MGSLDIIDERHRDFKHYVSACCRCERPFVTANDSAKWAVDLYVTVQCLLNITQPTSHRYSPKERDLVHGIVMSWCECLRIFEMGKRFHYCVGAGRARSAGKLRRNAKPGERHVTRPGDMTPYRSLHPGGVDGGGRYRWPFLSKLSVVEDRAIRSHEIWSSLSTAIFAGALAFGLSVGFVSPPALAIGELSLPTWTDLFNPDGTFKDEVDELGVPVAGGNGLPDYLDQGALDAVILEDNISDDLATDMSLRSGFEFLADDVVYNGTVSALDDIGNPDVLASLDSADDLQGEVSQMQHRAAQESLADHGKKELNGYAHANYALPPQPEMLEFLRPGGFMEATEEICEFLGFTNYDFSIKIVDVMHDIVQVT